LYASSTCRIRTHGPLELDPSGGTREIENASAQLFLRGWNRETSAPVCGSATLIRSDFFKLHPGNCIRATPCKIAGMAASAPGPGYDVLHVKSAPLKGLVHAAIVPCASTRPPCCDP